MKTKYVALFLSVVLFFSLLGCNNKNKTSKSNKTDNEIVNNKKQSISLLYTKADTFNPYTASTESNRNICKLIFEPLVKTDNSFNPVYRVAESIDFIDTTCNVKIKSITFSDDSPVTSSDVLYSYNLARNSNTIYATHLYEVVSCTVIDSLNISFKLSQYDPYFVNLLDFPILKSNSENTTTSDGVLLPPIGCGRYIPDAEKTKLTINTTFFGNIGQIKTINLINAPDNDSLSHYIEVGAAEMYYADPTGDNVVRMSGNRSKVSLNNLVYIGINSSNPLLSNKSMRYAISSAINRKVICSDAYYNNATVAKGYFNSNLKDVTAVQSLKTISDVEISVENLNKIGYNVKDNDGYCLDGNGNRVSFTLIVNTENRSRAIAASLIASQAKSAGIQITVKELSFADYLTALQTNGYDLYLGEISVLPNYDLTNLVVAGGSAAYGVGLEPQQLDEQGNPVATDNPIASILSGYHSGSNSISDVAGVLLTEMPQIPICYRNDLFFYKNEIKSGVISTESDCYFSIENYEF